MRKIGLMGGTFDPIHKAHLALAECAYRQLSLDEVWFLPAGEPYLGKSSATPASVRGEMVAEAIGGIPYFKLSYEELQRVGRTYTVDTLRSFRTRYPDCTFYFIVGSDQLYGLEKWWKTEEIFQLAHIVAAEREYPDRERSFSEQAEYLQKKYGGYVHLLNFSEMDISSTEIRERVRDGQEIQELVPASVEAYIKNRGLYRTLPLDEV